MFKTTCTGKALDYCTAPCPWVRRWAGAIDVDGPVLDLACGGGRHTAYLTLLGYPVIAIDREIDGMKAFESVPTVTLLEADVENGPWPLEPKSLAGIVITNYLHRPHFRTYYETLKSGGLFIMETFTTKNTERFGRPRNPDHVLKPGELYRLMSPEAELVAYEETQTEGETFVARIVWRKP